ncbi:adoMet-dependent rRNA methyltransferase spb1 [Cajanus cajan]|uniref:Putative rRNA methyltransferase n=1 Tax=Cajanus cajan TaxID=3821 RepID=A0A151TGB4_CAJCA|nr:adoMet-dependent rRNA methyltransferase spb1 [Cajanus cajan]KYP66091.1 AdoMet-dependent rRNA methyltransferase spb1 [Cajanus cajan]
MGKAKGKHRLDKYYHLAKEHGYRSRASWKLVQLNSKFHFLESSRAVLDLCAAPGGWMQVAVQRVPVDHLVIGVDLAPIAPIRGAIAIQEDITRPECKSRIKKLMNEHGCRAFDVVLHDGSPNVGGAWAQEATSQNALVIDAVKLATQFLAPKGIFVTKIFRSQDYSSVVYCLKQLFEKVEVDKPAASRSESAEIYVLGLRYKAPAKIDPRLLDVKHLFQGSVEPQSKVVDVLRDNKQKRHRDGYEEGNTTLRKISTAANFIWSDSPLEILGSVTSITFTDPADLPIKDHELTTEEVKSLCDDLRVLGKQDFKHLLKWRIHIRKALSPAKKADPTTTEQVEKEQKVDEEDRILNEMEELTNVMDRKKKRAKKLLAKRRAKDKARKATGMQMDAVEDGYVDLELFSLSSIKGKKDLVAVDNTEYEGDEVEDSENEEIHEGQKHSSSDLDDSDEERKRYDEQMEDLLDQAYEKFVIRKEGSTKQRKRIKKSYDAEAQLLEGGEDDDIVESKYDSDEDQADQEANPLMVPLNDGAELTQEEIMNKWFSQDVFAEAAEEGDFEKEESKDEMDIDEPKEKTSIAKKVKENKTTASAVVDHPQSQASKAAEDFEIVPAPATDSSDDSSSDSESEEEDIEAKAEILAYAKKMLRKKQREQILDDAYNKYMFDDEGLPKWFLDEEKKHRQPIKPISKEEIAAMKAQFKEIDARPAKKVAEAKARKKRVAMRKLEKVRKKANAISDQADISDRSKRKQIEQLYKKAVPKRPKKEYVVAKKGVQVKTGKGKVLVDRRMKKDARKRGMGKAGKGGSKMKGKAPKGKASSKASAKSGRHRNK